MSRIGRAPIAAPAGVKVEIAPNNTVTVTGPKGTLKRTFPATLKIEQGGDGALTVTRPDDSKTMRSLHGLSRTLLANMVTGVKDGFTQVAGTAGRGLPCGEGRRVSRLPVGYSHPVQVIPPDGISFTVEGVNRVTVSGIDKQLVGQVAANIRSIRKPEPYKGKGIRYAGEVVRMKAGKAGKAAGGKKK